MRSSTILTVTFLIVVVILLGIVFATFFQQIPTEGNTLAMDWKNSLWPALRDGLTYESGGLFNPPWSVLPLLPLGLLPVQISWGIVAYVTLLVMIISVPRVRKRWLYWLSVFLLVLSYPSIRNVVDGNLEALIILGVLLLLWGYEREQPVLIAIGALLATSKPQTTSLLLIAFALYLRRYKKPRLYLMAAAFALVIVIPSMLWRGPQWLDLMFQIPDQGSIMDISLMAALERAAIFPDLINHFLWVVVIVSSAAVAWISNRGFSREKAGMLIAASLLIAPYAGSTLTLVAIGVIPLFQKRRWLGGSILALNWMLTLLNNPAYRDVLGYISTFVLIATWLGLAWAVWMEKRQAEFPAVVGQPTR